MFKELLLLHGYVAERLCKEALHTAAPPAAKETVMGLRLRNGVWYVRKMIGGRRIELSTGYPENEKKKAGLAATKIVSRYLDQKNGLAPADETDAPEVPTFAAWAADYIKTYSSAKSKPARDAAIIDWWKRIAITKSRTWGQTPLDQFRQVDCLAALDARRAAGVINPRYQKQGGKISEQTVQRERGLIQGMFAAAVKNGLITKNPWEGVEKESAEPGGTVLSPEHEALLVSETPVLDTEVVAPLTPQFRRFVQFLLQTGLRLEECRQLEPRDVHKTHVHVHGKGRKRLTLCKVCGRQGGKCRNVPLTTKAATLLREQWDAEGHYWNQTQARLREVVNEGCLRAGIPHYHPHDFRHTFGHRWLTGVLTGTRGDIHTLSKVLGHSSIAVTEKHYAHLLESDIDKRVREVMEGSNPAA